MSLELSHNFKAFIFLLIKQFWINFWSQAPDLPMTCLKRKIKYCNIAVVSHKTMKWQTRVEEICLAAILLQHPNLKPLLCLSFFWFVLQPVLLITKLNSWGHTFISQRWRNGLIGWYIIITIEVQKPFSLTTAIHQDCV
jgi:hypothetical protein